MGREGRLEPELELGVSWLVKVELELLELELPELRVKLKLLEIRVELSTRIESSSEI